MSLRCARYVQDLERVRYQSLVFGPDRFWLAAEKLKRLRSNLGSSRPMRSKSRCLWNRSSSTARAANSASILAASCLPARGEAWRLSSCGRVGLRVSQSLQLPPELPTPSIMCRDQPIPQQSPKSGRSPVAATAFPFVTCSAASLDWRGEASAPSLPVATRALPFQERDRSCSIACSASRASQLRPTAPASG